MINLNILIVLCSLGTVVMSFSPGRHNFFLSPFNENFYGDSAVLDPSILAIPTSVEQKLANQELYSTVMDSIRDTLNKDSKYGKTIDLKMNSSPTKKRHYNQNGFDVLAGGGLG